MKMVFLSKLIVHLKRSFFHLTNMSNTFRKRKHGSAKDKVSALVEIPSWREIKNNTNKYIIKSQVIRY